MLISCLIWSHLHFYKLWCNKVWQFKRHLKSESLSICVWCLLSALTNRKGSFSPFIWLTLFDIQQTASKNWHNGILTHTYRERQTEREGETGTAKISALAYESYICVSVCVCVVYGGLLYEAQWSVEWYSTRRWTWLCMSHSELKVMSRGTPQKPARAHISPMPTSAWQKGICVRIDIHQ